MESGGESGSNAEASGGALQRVFYCHECQRRTFPNVDHIENFTCMSCGSGFVEDVTIREDSPSSQSDDQSWGGLEAAFADTVEGLAEGLEDWDEDTASAASSGASNTSGGRRPRHHRRTRVHMGQNGPISDQFIQSLIANLIGGATMAGGRGTPFADLPPGSIHIATAGNGRGFPGLFQVAGGGGGGSGGAGVPFSMPLYGNPGDYAWGRGGLDAIVTQLLNQMDGTGPPPMSTDEIQKVPTIKVTQSHIDAKQQCSVCWDDFKLDEDVRQLRCEHIFHEACIIPWLELHNTCPVCRKEQEVNPEQSAKTEVAGSTSHSEETSSGVSSGPSPASSLTGTTSGDQRGQRGQQNPDQLMEALGRSISVFTNSFFGIPPNQTAPPSTASSSTTRSTSNATSSSSSSAGPSTTSSSTSTSAPSSSGSQQQPDQASSEGGGGGSSFQDMDLE